MIQICEAVVKHGAMMQEHSTMWSHAVWGTSFSMQECWAWASLYTAHLVYSMVYSRNVVTEHKQGSMVGGSSQVIGV